MPKIIPDPEIGMVINSLTVIGPTITKGKYKYTEVRCNCGAEYYIDKSQLLTGKTISCKACAVNKRRVDHSVEYKRLHRIWEKMKYRTTHPTGRNACYVDISVCTEWLEFNTFYTWAMANGYAQGLSIDRIDRDGDYHPDNCRWVDTIVQAQNQGVSSRSTTGYKGVYEDKPRGSPDKRGRYNVDRRPFYTIIIYEGKRKYLTGYATAKEAYEARLKYFKEFLPEGRAYAE
jgi:hypothetical protein